MGNIDILISDLQLFKMIYQATVTFHVKQAIVKVPGQGDVPMNVQKKYLIAASHNKLTFMVPPETAICRIYLSPCYFMSVSQTECQLTHNNPYQNKNQAQKTPKDPIVVVTIKSTKECIDQIRAKCTPRKYKSCLSFTPSEVRHVSILSGQSNTQKYRGFINLLFIMFVVLNLRNIYDNFLKYGLRFLQYPTQFFPLTAFLGLLLEFVFLQLGYRINCLRFHNILSDKTVRYLLKINQVGLLIFAFLYCKRFLIPTPIAGIIISAFAIIFFLKLVSHMQVNTQIFAILDRSAALASSQFNQYVFSNHQISPQNLKIILMNRKDWQPLISRKRFYYFIVAPTLCYQLQYPRSPPPRVDWVLKRIVEFFLIGALLLVLWLQYMQPELQAWAREDDKTATLIIYRLLRLSIPNTVGWILGFYMLFHVLLNIISEIIQFGDRNFYSDWWNCRNLEEYWKTWNLPVHFFFIRHCYTPLLKLGSSKIAANLLVFILSAIAHEYIVDVTLGLLSYWVFLGMLLQAPAIFIQKLISKTLRIQNSELGNVSFWLFFCFLGQPTCLFVYYSLYMKTHGE